MKINNIKINAYGKLKNRDFNFTEGFNIIKGDNESGKSTMLNYITDMFYGISKNKDGKEISDFEKYKPWVGDDFSGKLNYSLDKGESFEIFREFKSKNPKIYNEKMEDISKDFSVDKKEGNQFFVEQTKIDKTMYLSTIVSMQQGVRLESKDQNVLVQKMANIASSGDDSISFKKASEKLQNKIRDEIGSNKTSQKPRNILQNKIEELNSKIDNIEGCEDRKYSIDKEKEEYMQKIEHEKKRKNVAMKLQMAENNSNSAKQQLSILANNKKENMLKLENLYQQRLELENSKHTVDIEIEKTENMIEQKKVSIQEYQEKQSTNSNQNVEKSNKKSGILIITSILLSIILVANMFFIKNAHITIGTIITIIILLIVYLASNHKENKKIKENRQAEIKRLEELKNTIEQEKNEIEKLESNSKVALTKQNDIIKQMASIEGMIHLLEESNNTMQKQSEMLETQMHDELKSRQEKIVGEDNSISIDQISELLECKDLESKIQSINENIAELDNKCNKIELEENDILPKLEKLVILKEQKEAAQEKLIELNHQENVIQIAIDSLKEAYEEMKTSITPKFTKELSESIKEISNGKYDKVMINDEKGMIVENENGEYIDINRLSTGTIDELYLSLRLAMIDDLSEEKMPILLDETFAYFDTERLEATMQFLKTKADKHQIFIFTCSNREIESLEKLKISYQLISLS